MSLPSETFKSLVKAAAEQVIASAPELTSLDQAIGDGDHGTNMKRGCEAVLGKLDAISAQPLDEAFKMIGKTLVMTVGGASGPLYGSFFLAAGEALSHDKQLPDDLADVFGSAVNAVSARGRVLAVDRPGHGESLRPRFKASPREQADQIREGHRLATELGFQIISSQPQYSMLWRVIEPEVVPACEELGISQIVWSPMAQGVLSGKYLPGQQPPEGSRATDQKGGAKMIERWMRDDVLDRVQQLKPLAEESGSPEEIETARARNRRVEITLVPLRS